jgi:hypothetical protein
MFGLAVRLLGMVFIYQGLQAIPAAAPLFVSALPHDLGPHVSEPMNSDLLLSALFMIGWPLFLAQWLIRGAPLVMRIAYPDTPARGQDIGVTIAEKSQA